MWILRINAAARMYKMKYSMFINYLLRSNIKLNRKVLADLAINEPLSFRSVMAVAQETAARERPARYEKFRATKAIDAAKKKKGYEASIELMRS